MTPMKQTMRSTVFAGAALAAGMVANAWEVPVGKQKIDFHGFASQGYLLSSDYDYLGATTGGGSFSFNEFGLNASISPFKRTRITAQAFAFDIGDAGNYDVLLDYASIEYTFSDYIGVRGGRVRKPGGIYNHIQDVDVARTSVLLPQGIYDIRFRDFSASIDGGLLFGNIPAGKGGSVSYEAFVGAIAPSDDGGLARQIANSLPPAPIGSFGTIDTSLVAGGQLWWSTPITGLRVGVLGAYLPSFQYSINVNPPFGPGTMDQDLAIVVNQFSIEYLWKSWTFQAEYYRIGVEIDTLVGGVNTGSDSSESDSWYVSAAYRFTKWFEAGTYYSEYYADTADRGGHERAVASDAYQKDLALSLRFDIKDWWIMKLEGHYIRGTGQIFDNARNPERNDDGWWLLAAKTTFSF